MALARTVNAGKTRKLCPAASEGIVEVVGMTGKTEETGVAVESVNTIGLACCPTKASVLAQASHRTDSEAEEELKQGPEWDFAGLKPDSTEEETGLEPAPAGHE